MSGDGNKTYLSSGLITMGLLLAPAFLAAYGAWQAAVPMGNYSDSLIVTPAAHDPQFLKYPDGRQQLIYTVDSQYPAKSVLLLISTELRKRGWQPLGQDFMNRGVPSSHVRGWQQFEDATQEPPVTVRAWNADWENSAHEITKYILEYRSPFPETNPPDLRTARVVALYIPAAVVEEMKHAVIPKLSAGESTHRDIKMRCRVKVPKEYRNAPFDKAPNGEPESVRYTVAYEAFWWNCVAVRAADLRGRCPAAASGTPAASAGANDGASDADSQIERLLKKYAAAAVQKYLQSIASSVAAKEKMRPYFAKPSAEAVN